MTGARVVHDTLEACGWEVEIADAQKVKGLAPLACKTDMIDSKVLAVLSHRDLVPAVWLPDPRVRKERELARFRLHLIKHRSMLKHRVHSTLVNFGRPCPVTDLFGVEGRRLLARLDVPEPWRGNVAASVELIDDLDRQVDEINRKLKAGHADHPYIPLLLSAPGIGWVLAFTIVRARSRRPGNGPARRRDHENPGRADRPRRYGCRPSPASSTPPDNLC
jgi:transposase